MRCEHPGLLQLPDKRRSVGLFPRMTHQLAPTDNLHSPTRPIASINILNATLTDSGTDRMSQ
jgi:hypothetical protein